MITAQWRTAQCETSPDVIYGWNLLNESATSPPPNYRWPAGYFVHASYRPYEEKCFGTLKARLSKECCAISLKIPRDYESYTTILADPANPLATAPVATNGAKYCHLVANPYNASSPFPYHHAYYNSNGVCIVPDSVRCFENNTIAKYPSSQCGGNPSLFNLDFTRQAPVLYSRGVTVVGDMVTVSGATSEFSWIVRDKPNWYIPKFTDASDFVMCLNYIFAILAILFSFSKKVYECSKARRLRNILEAASHLFWLTFVVLRFVNQWGFWNTSLDGSQYFFLMVGSLSSMLLSIDFFFSIYRQYAWFKWYFVGIIFLVHFGCNWNNYTRFRIILITFTAEMVYITNALNVFWIMLMYVIDCIPPLATIYYLTSRSGSPLLEEFQKLWLLHKRIFIVTGLQVLLGITFLTLFFIREGSEILGGDKWWTVFLSYDPLCHSVHSVLNLWLVSEMSKVVAHFGSSNTKSKIETSALPESSMKSTALLE
jgi:hypothetical protein